MTKFLIWERDITFRRWLVESESEDDIRKGLFEYLDEVDNVWEDSELTNDPIEQINTEKYTGNIWHPK